MLDIVGGNSNKLQIPNYKFPISTKYHIPMTETKEP
jgi:hypothetical protein